jgi:surface protein
MKRFTNQSNGSQAGRMYNGGAIIRRFALFPLMLLMLLLLPANMVAETDYDTSVTLKELAGNPVGYKGETYANLFDGKKEDGNFSKWCCEFSGSAYVILEASKAGIPVGYIITTGNDNANPKCGGRNPLSWKLYGNNEGKEGAWTLIDKVENDKVLQDKNYASYNFDCKCSTSYQYFKWEISAIHSGSLLQVGEFELKLKTCTHLKADGSSALGAAIKTVEPTCTEHGYTTKECSLCHLIVNEYLNLKPHTLTHHALKAATCTEAGNIEYWQCSVCNKLFSNEAATQEITDAASLEIQAKGHQYNSEGTCTKCNAKGPRYTLFDGLDGITDVTFTCNGDYPWKMLDLGDEGMSEVSSYITDESIGLMSNNYEMDYSTSEIVIKFNVEKPILFSFKYLISAEYFDKFIITLNGKMLDEIRETNQKVYKSILNKGEYSLTLSYEKDGDISDGADRAIIYDLNTATTIDDYIADYESSNNTITFKKINSDNLGALDSNHTVIVCNEPTVNDVCSFLGIKYSDIKSVVFDESFITYTPTSLNGFFRELNSLQTITGLKYLNTANVTDMGCMFNNCQNLNSLDLTSFNTPKVEHMSYMFLNCYALTTIYASDNFVTGKVTDGSRMFSGCTNLKGFIHYMSNPDKIDQTYANYKTGYFTKLVGKNGDEKIGATGETLATDNLVLDDGKDFVAYEPFAAKAASYSRTVEGTTWATLCLPFEVSLDGQNFRAFKLLSADEGTETVELEEIETSIEAGTPVIIKMKDGETKLDFTVANKEIANEVKTAETDNGNYQLQGLYTQKEFSKDTDNNCYIVKGDKLMSPAKLLGTSTKSVGSKPFRAYMVDNSSAPAAGARMFSISVGGSTTAIEQLESTADSKAEYYDLQGRRLQNLQKGVNIVKRGGKTMKVIIK